MELLQFAEGNKVNKMKLTRNFFYKKNRNAQTVRKNCFWTEVNGKKYLVSYQTIVCCVDENGVFHKFWDDYSRTTLLQVNRFLEIFENVRALNGEEVVSFSKYDWEKYQLESVPENDNIAITPYIPEM